MKNDLFFFCLETVRGRFPSKTSQEHDDMAKRMVNALAAGTAMVSKYGNELGTCPCCHQTVGDVTTSYTDATAVHVLYKLVDWCSANGRHEFTSSDVKHLLNHTQYANLNHLDRFGGIVYRPVNPKTGEAFKSKHYGINLTRAHEFFRNERAAPVQIISNRLTGERIASTEKFLRDFPGILEFLDDDGNYNPAHVVSGDDAVITKDLPTADELL